MSTSYLFTSESVTEGHPDKMCDIVSDSILDACFAEDPNSKVACETVAKSSFLAILGEITTKASLNYESIVRNAVRKIGYTDEKDGFSADSFLFARN
jgi:S-adenosylmethionine synthetase